MEAVMSDKQADKGYRVEYVPLAEVQRWPRNPKKHDEPGIEASLERWGFTEPLVLDEKSGKLVAGHGRLEALQRRKASGKAPPARIATKGQDWMVPVVRGIAFKDILEAEAYLLASNRLTEAGGWHEESLAEMLKDLVTAGSLEGTGYQQSDVDALDREVAAATARAASAATPPGEFQAFDENIQTQHECPKCHYQWSGASK